MSINEKPENKLPDILRPGLRVVICGSAAGDESARLKYYYAGRGNKFWNILFLTGLTPIRLQPQDFENLLEYNIGLTDLAKQKSGSDSKIKIINYDIESLDQKIRLFTPKCLCFNGKKAAEAFLKQKVSYGLQSARINTTLLFVAPSTSGAASGFWNEAYWFELARLI